MASGNLCGGRFSYETEGEGFPLVLLPGMPECWASYRPLLGELCRTIAYTYHHERDVPHAMQVTDLLTFLDALPLERVYLASHTAGWPIALECALRWPERLEGLVLLGTHGATSATTQALATYTARLPELSVPTLVLLDAALVSDLPSADLLVTHVPRCTRTIVPRPASAPSASPLQLAHAMMRMLVHWERQRNLVRGASFLL